MVVCCSHECYFCSLWCVCHQRADEAPAWLGGRPWKTFPCSTEKCHVCNQFRHLESVINILLIRYSQQCCHRIWISYYDCIHLMWYVNKYPYFYSSKCIGNDKKWQRLAKKHDAKYIKGCNYYHAKQCLVEIVEKKCHEVNIRFSETTGY